LQSANDLIAGTSASIQRNQTSGGQVLAPGAYWVTSNIGLVSNQAGLRLNQITIDNNGLIDFTIRSSIPAQGTVRLDSADGTLRYEIPVAFRLNPVRLYDFDHVNRGVFSPSASGYTRVLATNVYDQSAGFGWNSPVKSVDRGASARNLPTPVDLYRDNHFNSAPGTFFAMSEVGKTYSVTVYFGDTQARSVEVSLNGGATFERVNTLANSYTSRTWNIVASSDRIGLMFRKASGTNWSVNAIEVREQTLTSTSSNRTAKAQVWPSESLVGIQEAILPPRALTDLAATTVNSPLRLNVLSNDTSYFGLLNPNSIQIVSQPSSGTVSILEDGSLEFQPSTDFIGQVSFAYRVRDELGITSNYGEVLVNVTDRVHHNFLNPMDVNADFGITPIDVLLVIDRLNAQGSSPLTSVDHTQNQWVDVNGNGMLDPLDVLGIIDYLNQSTFGLSDSLGGEGESRIESLIDSDVNRVTTQGTDLESLSEKEVADRLSVFIEFGKDDEDENFWG
jgi:hypothetical protein